MNPLLNLTVKGAQALDLEPQDFVGTRCAVLGISGGGKTNTVAVLCEELLPHIPATIIDPEGEMWSLRERMDLLIVGRSENVDMEIQPHQAADVARWSVDNRQTVILDLFEYTQDEIDDIIPAYIEALWEACKRAKRPYHIIVEEADEFIPQPLSRDSIWKRVASRGRKYGLGIIMSSQRSQKLDKNVLTQADMAILHRVSHPRDMGVYKDIIPLETRQVVDMVNGLETGQAVVVRRGEVWNVSMRPRSTYHAGATPLLDDEAGTVVPLKAANTERVAALKRLVEASREPVIDPAIAERDRRITELEDEKILADSLIADLQGQLTQYKAHIQRLNDRVETLALLRVQVQMVSPQGEVQMVAAGAENQRPPARLNGTPAVFQPRMPLDTDTPQFAVDRQHKRLAKAVRWLQHQVEPVHQRLMAYLAHNPGDHALEQIAPAIGYAEQTLLSKPPLPLIERGMIVRSGKRGRYRYRAALHTFVQQQYPDIPLDTAYATLVDALPG